MTAGERACTGGLMVAVGSHWTVDAPHSSWAGLVWMAIGLAWFLEGAVQAWRGRGSR
jgi:hypothetical protein